MTHIPAHFRVPFAPRAHADATITLDEARFTVLTSRLIRMEYSPDGTFEDRPSQAIWYREQPVPAFTTYQEGTVRVIETEHLLLRYDASIPGFTERNLSIVLRERGTTWFYGDPDTSNLKGTARTLDNVSGAVPLDNGLISRSGWAILDDSQSLVFNESYWLEARTTIPDTLDLYFFGYDSDYTACMRDYIHITGPTPMLPRWALGNWWSRYWAYSDKELLDLMQEFRTRDIPLSVCIVDMDWHITDTGNESSGWTGYTWNPDLFPDPEAFIRQLHQLGLRTALNLHPHAGVYPHEAAYPEMASRLGIDPATERPVRFDIADPAFVNAYFELLHHPKEAIGVDFWWMDWQQGEETSLPGLDPLWWLNHLHFLDLARDGQRRPFVFSRWGGFGNHRYPIGFSGDTFITWKSLAFQPYFTATAANVAYGWWSHDLGGHFRGTEDAELYTRWVQFGVFSPITRLHATKDALYDRRPWAFDRTDVLQITTDALKLRHRMIPYLYTMSWLNHTEHLPLIRPMYHSYPDSEEAHACPEQYTFGTELIAVPFTAPVESSTGHSRAVVWLPDGEWTHFFSGAAYGSGWHALYGRLEEIPVFARAGAIVPLAAEPVWSDTGNPTALEIHVFAGADNTFVLYEDDGVSTSEASCRTTLTQHWQDSRLVFIIQPPEGDLNLLPDERTYILKIRSVKQPTQIQVLADNQLHSAETSYDVDGETLTIHLAPVTTSAGVTVTVNTSESTLLARRDRTYAQCINLLRHFRLETEIKSLIMLHMKEIIAEPQNLAKYVYFMPDTQIRALLEITQRIGIHTTRDLGVPVRIVLWNHHLNPDMTFRYTQLNTRIWRGDNYIHYDTDVVPAFRVIEPVEEDYHDEVARWQVLANYLNLVTVSDERAT